MVDETSIRTLLGPADPARDAAVPPPRTPAAELIAIAEAPAPVDPAGYRGAARPARRRLAVAAVTAVIAAGAVAATAGIHSVTRDGPAPPGRAGGSATPSGTPAELRLGPVVRPVAMRAGTSPVDAGDRLRALAGAVGPAPYDGATGRYTYVHTVDWNAVFDDAPGGTAQVIFPQDKRLWYTADGSGRQAVRPLPPVYPNEQSRRYWQQHATALPATSEPRVDDLPADRAGPSEPLTTDPAELAARLGVGEVDRYGPERVLSAVRDLYSVFAPPPASRAHILRILADLPGVSWHGSVTDRAGRAGVAISVDTGATRQVLILDEGTGGLLAWDEVERPTDTVAGATLYLGYDRTDRLG
ncbi:CU044_5270 family protein [Phytohabitans houttuyneae]|uniref:CU044_5270 family protein n=1 Tax=Phytohabitans houttuyneae TaxID=1076126 RepID=A0A6V8KTS7_9ACTN|nr:CU044_5270 family protein [Phytohabitans houttuyneae]GFJ83995.1 hypothetical protein Phou_081750 [Phytohabitans houttuyneae]